MKSHGRIASFIPVRREFIPFGIGSIALFLGVYLLSGSLLFSTPFLVLFLLFLNFFRDPERYPESKTQSDIVSPADGKVFLKDEVEIKGELAELVPSISGKKYRRIAIFMSPLDVHVNRSPSDGKVLSLARKNGGFARAFLEKSEKNARVIWAIEGEGEKFFLIQIAGALARRISTFKSEGDPIRKAERIGIIYFGSRVDLYLPADKYEFVVDVGQKVFAGRTTVARRK